MEAVMSDLLSDILAGAVIYIVGLLTAVFILPLAFKLDLVRRVWTQSGFTFKEKLHEVKGGFKDLNDPSVVGPSASASVIAQRTGKWRKK